MYNGAHFNLVEKNRFYDHGLKMKSNPIRVSRNHEPWNPGAFQCFKGCSQIIVRKNIFHNNGNVLAHTGKNMYFYNNTADRQLITVYSEGGNYDFKFNKYKNNIFSNTSSLGWPDDNEYIYSWLTYIQSGYVMEQNTISHNIFTGENTKWRYSNNKTHSYFKGFEGSSKDIYANKTENPSFVSRKEKDFRQTSDSASIDAGTWLTRITSPTGKNQISFTVEDAGYFFDGWGIPLEDGDFVKTANGKITKIIKIDYNKNKIFVDPAIDIIEGEGLSLDYSGNRPDIGAFESDSSFDGKLEPPTLRLRSN